MIERMEKKKRPSCCQFCEDFALKLSGGSWEARCAETGADLIGVIAQIQRVKSPSQLAAIVPPRDCPRRGGEKK